MFVLFSADDEYIFAVYCLQTDHVMASFNTPSAFPFAFQIGSINGGGRMLQAVQRRSFAFQEVIFNHQEVDAGSRRCRHQFVVRPMMFLE